MSKFAGCLIRFSGCLLLVSLAQIASILPVFEMGLLAEISLWKLAFPNSISMR